ncbi:hypothetical protein CERZMDRAFT_99313 [Cercospora zeae-maydis SCOH1-5]|uniref:Uncharacterized protein n=1 Tax=Cercospora zeae-maydis SCOH1-5 TaxID=717836 RepID=A0A6A6FBG9_9PEZI|nr:hypothetical protein CERZMDRAFT_99313 [Cercospora zeae-maydis SCOH1-5]
MNLIAKRQAVFEAVESLRHRLRHEIYKSRPVSKYWAEIVGSSPSIRTKLFLRISKPTGEVRRIIKHWGLWPFARPLQGLRGYHAVSSTHSLFSPWLQEELNTFSSPRIVLGGDETIAVYSDLLRTPETNPIAFRHACLAASIQFRCLYFRPRDSKSAFRLLRKP